jgi:hypothetical protein
MKKISFIFLVFLHNLLFSLLVVFGSYSQSFLASIVALVYWILGWLIIFRERKLTEMSEADHKRPSPD